MAGVVFCMLAGLRARARPLIFVAITAGIATGVIISAVAIGARTDSSYERYLVSARADDASAISYAPEHAVESLRAESEVASSSRARQVFFVEPPAQRELSSFGENAAVDAAIPLQDFPIDRPLLVTGRWPDPRRPDEIAVGFTSADRFHTRVGDRPYMKFGPPGVTLEELPTAPTVLSMRMTVTGTIAFPGQFPPTEPFGDVYLTPAFWRLTTDKILYYDIVVARLHHGSADFEMFQKHAAQLLGDETLVSSQRLAAVETDRSAHVVAVVLWLFAAFAAVALILILGQALARQAAQDAVDDPTLHVLGLSRRQLLAVATARATMAGALAAVIAFCVATGLSAVGPLGRIATVADPAPGIHVDVATFVIGAVALVALIVLMTALPVWVATRTLTTEQAASTDRPSRLGNLLAGGSVPPGIASGIRYAIAPGRGRSALPVRTSLLGATVSVAALTAALTFGTSFHHLTSTPRLYGWDWDVSVGNPYVPDSAKGVTDLLRRVPGVEAVASGTTAQVELQIDGRSENTWGLDEIKGSAVPTIVSGRWPRADDEVALGTKTLRQLGLHLGDPVEVRFGSASLRMHVVGTAVFPIGVYNIIGNPGDGAGVTFRALASLAPRQTPNLVTIRFASGADRSVIEARLHASGGPNADITPAMQGTDLRDLERVDYLPLVLAGLLALVAIANLGHALVGSIRGRRHDFAVLKAVGFVRPQILLAVLAQALTMCVVAIVVGIPTGIALGRWLWEAFSSRTLGTLPEPAVSPPAILLIAVVGVAAGLLVAVIPGRAASLTPPSPVLKSE